MKTFLLSLQVFAFAIHAISAAPGAPLRFSGKIFDSAEKPIVGAVVARYEYSEDFFQPGADWELKEQITTSTDGGFDLVLPRTQAFFVVSKPGLAPAWRQQWNAPQGLTNQQIVLSTPVALAGVVVDEADKPVADAEVYMSMAISQSPMPGGGRNYNYLSGKIARTMFTSRTSSEGRFRIEGLPETGLNLAVRAAGKALRNDRGRQGAGPDSMPWRSGDLAIKLVLEPAGSIEGKIAEQETGRPIRDVQVMLEPQQGGGFGHAPTEPARSGPDGTFKIADVAAGSHRLRAIFSPLQAPDWVAETALVTVESGRAAGAVQLNAVRGGLLHVRATTKADRQPIPHVMINAYRENFQTSAKSDPNGVALLRLLPGDYQINAYRDNYRGDPQSATVTAGQTNQLEMELSPPPKVNGIVRQPDGQPAPGAEVRMIGHGGGGPEIRTDDAGRFEMEWYPQRHGGMEGNPCLLVRMPEKGWAVAEEFDEEARSLDLRLAPALTYVGEAKTPDGRAITNVTAALVFWTGNMGMHLQGLSTKTNPPGRFEIAAMPPGRRYGVIVSAPGFGQKFIQQVPDEPSAGGKVELEQVELNVANLKLAGQVLDENDKPVPGAFVNLQGEGQPQDNTQTDRDGRFEFARVCEGPAQIFTHAREMFGNVTAQGGETNVVVQLRPQGAGMGDGGRVQRLKGVVTGVDGKPADGVRVRLFTPMHFNAQWSRTDSNGVFRATSNQRPGRMGAQWLVAHDPSTQSAAAMEVEEDATELNLQLEKGAGIIGQVQDADGKPLPNATVELMLASNRMEQRWDDKPVRLDAQGQFELGGLPVDLSYRVYASAPGFGRSKREVNFPEAHGPKVNMPPFLLKPANLPLAGQILNEDEKPVPNAQVQASGSDQPQVMTNTDRQGRFKLKVCEGSVQLFVHMGESFGNSTVEGGETNVVMTLARRGVGRGPTRRRSLQGKPLPDLASLGLPADALPRGRAGVVCLLDWEQRLSRRALGLLADQADVLKQKGVAVAVVQSVPTSDETWNELKSAVQTDSFRIGRLKSKTSETRWASDAKPLPWLILVDKEGRVIADGFSPDELETEIEILE